MEFGDAVSHYYSGGLAHVEEDNAGGEPCGGDGKVRGDGEHVCKEGFNFEGFGPGVACPVVWGGGDFKAGEILDSRAAEVDAYYSEEGGDS